MTNMRTLTLLAALLGGAACGDDDDGGTAPATEFTASLNGDNEVPAVATDATGTATLSIEGDQINYTVEVNGLENAVFAHIHIAPEGENGPVVLNLCGTGPPEPACVSGDGVLATGTNGTSVVPAITFDSLVSAMRTGGAYVNVHTDDGVAPPSTGAGDMISGEIRGQVEAQ